MEKIGFRKEMNSISWQKSIKKTILKSLGEKKYEIILQLSILCLRSLSYDFQCSKNLDMTKKYIYTFIVSMIDFVFEANITLNRKQYNHSKWIILYEQSS